MQRLAGINGVVDDLLDQAEILRMNRLFEPCHVHDQIRRITKNLPRPLGDPERLGIPVQDPHAGFRGLGGEAQAQQAFTTRLIRAFAGQRVGENLGDHLQTRDLLIRPRALLARGIQRQGSDRRLASD